MDGRGGHRCARYHDFHLLDKDKSIMTWCIQHVPFFSYYAAIHPCLRAEFIHTQLQKKRKVVTRGIPIHTKLHQRPISQQTDFFDSKEPAKSLSVHIHTYVQHTGETPLQILLLPPRPRILVQMPLDIALLILQRARANLKKSHTHPGSHLRKLHALESRFDKNMMPHFNRILYVLKRDNAVSHFGRGFAGREEVFEDLHAAGTERGSEAVEDEVWV